MAEQRTAPESEAQRTSRGLAEAARDAEEKNLGETVEGGRYLVNDVLVDAEGKPLSEKKS